MNVKVHQSLQNLEKALKRLEEATQIFDRIHDLYVEELKSLFRLLKTKL
ncbi:MAG: hypothetical protein K2X08_06865 [Chlamydiales bacterium]|nr:hypothetical protein [Chlamydiales bacterium]